MTRQEEINEFAGVLNVLMKKYNVSLGVNVTDLNPKEEPKDEVPSVQSGS